MFPNIFTIGLIRRRLRLHIGKRCHFLQLLTIYFTQFLKRRHGVVFGNRKIEIASLPSFLNYDDVDIEGKQFSSQQISQIQPTNMHFGLSSI